MDIEVGIQADINMAMDRDRDGRGGKNGAGVGDRDGDEEGGHDKSVVLNLPSRDPLIQLLMLW